MIWIDTGIVLSSKKHSEEYLIVDIFTKNRGRFSGMYKNGKNKFLSQTSVVCVEMHTKNNNDFGFWKIKSEKQNWVFSMKNNRILFIYQSIRFILNKTLPHSMSNLSVFLLTEHLFEELKNVSDDEALILYAYFEFMLINSIGYGFDLNQCSVCGKKENITHISKKTGQTASKTCFEKIFEKNSAKIPDCWQIFSEVFKNKTDPTFIKKIKNSNLQEKNIVESLQITGKLINQYTQVEENYFRNNLINSI